MDDPTVWRIGSYTSFKEGYAHAPVSSSCGRVSVGANVVVGEYVGMGDGADEGEEVALLLQLTSNDLSCPKRSLLLDRQRATHAAEHAQLVGETCRSNEV